MNSLIQDAINLCQLIDSSVPPYSNYEIVNIAIDSGVGGVTRGGDIMPKFYKYTMENVPRLLRDQGVFLALIIGRWYIGKFKENTLNKMHPRYHPPHTEDVIQLKDIARKVGLYSSDESPFFYVNPDASDPEIFGIRKRGQYTILIDMQKARNFMALYSQKSPSLDNVTGVLTLGGKSVTFKGDITIKSVELLVNNLNSIVLREDFYNIPRGSKSYKTHIKEKGKTKIHDILNKQFDSVKATIFENNDLNRLLIPCKTRFGYGLFINQSVFKNPKKSTDNS